MSDERDRRDGDPDDDTEPVWGYEERDRSKQAERRIEEAERRERDKPERRDDQSDDG